MKNGPKNHACINFRSRRSFTLLELLIGLGILAILAVIVLLVINPAEYLRRTRDTKRQTDLQTLNSAINFSQAIDFGLPLGLASTVYVSLPDNSSTTCGSLGLPALPPTWQYHCSSNADYQKTNGTGWIPINFNSLSTGSPLANLPVDPVNASSTGFYYSYVPGGSWELTTAFESQKYQNLGINDGGHDPLVYEVGSDLKLVPFRHLAVGSDCVLFHAYWDGTAVDHSGHGNNGTVTGGANFVEQGLNVTGADGKVAVSPSSSLNFGTSDFARFYWFNTRTDLYARFDSLYLFEPGIEGYSGFNYLGQWPWYVTSWMRQPVSNWYYSDPSDIYLDMRNQWHFIGYEINRDVGGYLSLDGVIIAGPFGDIKSDRFVNTYDLTLSQFDPPGGIMGEAFWFNAFGTYSGMTRSQLYNATKGRYGL